MGVEKDIGWPQVAMDEAEVFESGKGIYELSDPSFLGMELLRVNQDLI